MKIVILTLYAGIWLQLLATLVIGQTQVCPDSAINKCVSYIMEPMSGSTLNHQKINESLVRLTGLSACLSMNDGCPADEPVTTWVKDEIHYRIAVLCTSNEGRFINASSCWNKAGTLSEITSCNSTFSANQTAGISYCDAAEEYLVCVLKAVETDCGQDARLFYEHYALAYLVGHVVAKNCQKLNGQCLKWNMTRCMSSLNEPLGAVGLGKNELKSSLDRICGGSDDVTTCLISQSCPPANSFGQQALVITQLKDSQRSICQEINRTSYYASYADCWMTDSIKTGILNCNSTFRTNLATSATFCVSADTFLNCTKDLVTTQCSADSGVSVAAYFYTLLSVNASMNNCVIDSKFAPPEYPTSSPSNSTSSTASSSPSASMSASPSFSNSTSASASASPSVAISISPSISIANSTSASPYASFTASISASPSISSSISTSASVSASVPTFASVPASASVSVSVSASAAVSNSGSPSASAYASMITTDKGNSAVLNQGAFVLVLSAAAAAIFLQL